MREGLREVSQRMARRGIDLLGKEAHVVGESAEPFEQILRLFDGSAAERKILRAPEAADAERAFAERVRRAIPVE